MMERIRMWWRGPRPETMGERRRRMYGIAPKAPAIGVTPLRIK